MIIRSKHANLPTSSPAERSSIPLLCGTSLLIGSHYTSESWFRLRRVGGPSAALPMNTRVVRGFGLESEAQAGGKFAQMAFGLGAAGGLVLGQTLFDIFQAASHR